LEWVKGAERYIEKALMEKLVYDKSLTALMIEHGVASENVIITGYLMDSYHKQRDYDLRQKILTQYGALKSLTKRRCEVACDYHSNGPLDTLNRKNARLQSFAIAMYDVTWAERRAAKHGRSNALVSFPWMFLELLGQISMTSSRHEYKPKSKEHLENLFYTPDEDRSADAMRAAEEYEEEVKAQEFRERLHDGLETLNGDYEKINGVNGHADTPEREWQDDEDGRAETNDVHHSNDLMHEKDFVNADDKVNDGEDEHINKPQIP
jgi:hypothetical protein